MNWMPFCIQGDGSVDRHLVFRATARLASLVFSAKTDVVNMDSSRQKQHSSRSLIACRIFLRSIKVASHAT